MRRHLISGGVPFSHPPVRQSLGALRAGPVSFYDMSGNPIASIACGQPYTFNVPGYSQVWLVQTHNGVQQFNGVFPVPMAPYTANCTSEPGTYSAMVYTIVAGKQGQYIGSTSLSVLASVQAPTSSAGPTANQPAGGSGGGSSTTTTTTTSTGGGSTLSPAIPIVNPTSGNVLDIQSGITLTPTMIIGIAVLAFVFLSKD